MRQDDDNAYNTYNIHKGHYYCTCAQGYQSTRQNPNQVTSWRRFKQFCDMLTLPCSNSMYVQNMSKTHGIGFKEQK